MAVDLLPALAGIELAFLPGKIRVYDTVDEDPTPDALTLPTDYDAVLIHLDPYQLQYDTDDITGGKRSTQGLGAITNDRSTVLSVLIFGVYDLLKIGWLQARARPYCRYLYKDCIWQHNTLTTGVVYKAQTLSATAGNFDWGGITYYAAQFTNRIEDSRPVTPGS